MDDMHSEKRSLLGHVIRFSLENKLVMVLVVAVLIWEASKAIFLVLSESSSILNVLSTNSALRSETRILFKSPPSELSEISKESPSPAVTSVLLVIAEGSRVKA